MNKTEKTSYISFKSLKNPIKPFRISTLAGKLSVKEYRIKTPVQADAQKISSHYIENFIDGSIDPAWQSLNMHDNQVYKMIAKQKYSKFLADTFARDDGHTTLLVAKDSFGNVAGAVLSTTYNGFPTLDTKRILSIEGLAVNPRYRNCHVAQRLLQKIFKASEKDFDDVILTAYKRAVPFYEKNGFQVLEPDSLKKRIFLKFLRRDRDDLPEYVKIMTKPLNENSKRFYDFVNIPKTILAKLGETLKNSVESRASNYDVIINRNK